MLRRVWSATVLFISPGPSGFKNKQHLQSLDKTVSKTWWINYLAAAEMINCGADQDLHSKHLPEA